MARSCISLYTCPCGMVDLISAAMTIRSFMLRDMGGSMMTDEEILKMWERIIWDDQEDWDAKRFEELLDERYRVEYLDTELNN